MRAAAFALGGALAAVTGAMAVLTVSAARKVVAPAVRIPDTRILDLDVAAQTITLGRTPDTELPGRYGLFTSGTQTYVKLGSVLAEDASSVKRKLLTEVPSNAHLAAEAGFSGWYYDSPEQLHLPFTEELIGTSAGVCPAWLFDGDSDTWVIQVHGRGTTRSECLRAVPVFHALGMPVLVVSYRNDGEGARTRGGRYALGATEWRDVDAAIGFAMRAGARRVVLMGWSMGGAIVLQTALNAARRDSIAGIILESPVVDWRNVLHFQARQMRLPGVVTSLALGTLESEWTAPLARTAPISFDRLDVVARAGELRHPILLLHSDDDGYVPADASHALAAARPDLVDMEVFTGARHTKLWNYDQKRWTDAITAWLERTGMTVTDQTAD
ncbi:alpha/beta hydrolase [Microbacterium mangrovi]|uniref:Alpha/beta hydrolase n=1 Tax=Microbacterium mangrovi TaxID=1348253 RepID=A0A0B2A7G7_9MICO|nr:alpha/beta hydrolase [Microbacterium mangrovi]